MMGLDSHLKYMMIIAVTISCVMAKPSINDELDSMHGNFEMDRFLEMGKDVDDCSHRCDTGGQCIKSLEVCDGYNDCADASDEKDCNEPNTDTSPCQTGDEYFPIERRCDGIMDCFDGTDELNCSREDYKMDNECLMPCDKTSLSSKCTFGSNGMARCQCAEHFTGNFCQDLKNLSAWINKAEDTTPTALPTEETKLLTDGVARNANKNDERTSIVSPDETPRIEENMDSADNMKDNEIDTSSPNKDASFVQKASWSSSTLLTPGLVTSTMSAVTCLGLLLHHI